MKWLELICCNCEPLKRNSTVRDKEFYFWRNIFHHWKKFNTMQINGEHPNEQILNQIHICWKTIDNLFSKIIFQDDFEIFWSNSNIRSQISIQFHVIFRIWNLHLHCLFEIFKRHKNQHDIQAKAYLEHQSHLTKQQSRKTFKHYWTNTLFLLFNRSESWQNSNLIISPQP